MQKGDRMIKKTVFLVLILLASNLYAGIDDPAKLIKFAQDRINAGDYSGALKNLDAAISRDSNNGTAYSMRGAVLLRLGKYEGAIADFDVSARIDPKNYKVFYNRSMAKSFTGDDKGALADAETAVGIKPDDAAAYKLRALANSNLELFYYALKDFDRAIGLKPDAEAYYERATVKNNLKDYSGALEDSNKAIELNPNYKEAYIGRGEIRDNMGDYNGALADLNKAVELDPENADAYQMRGSVKESMGDANGALLDLKIADKLNNPPAAYSELKPVPGGTFTQTDGTNSFSHTISAFEIGKYQVTYDLWYTVYQWAVANGYSFANTGKEGSGGTIGAAPTAAKYQPVTTMNWRDVIVWCNAYSRKSGLTPVYCSDAGFTTPIKDSANGAYARSINTAAGSFDNPYVNWSSNGYRLPTEGEYQYAAGYINGSSCTPYNYAGGATADYTNAAATELAGWYNVNCSSTQAVGGKIANALGIYDMSGNVWEWCWDWYGAYVGASTNYRGPAGGAYRVMRGGSYYDDASYLQVGYRSTNHPYDAGSDYGFRFVRAY
jgi:formylglycine-generating enzyme required for sulfatase activity/Flp pilus assembly protein TadD